MATFCAKDRIPASVATVTCGTRAALSVAPYLYGPLLMMASRFLPYIFCNTIPTFHTNQSNEYLVPSLRVQLQSSDFRESTYAKPRNQLCSSMAKRWSAAFGSDYQGIFGPQLLPYHPYRTRAMRLFSSGLSFHIIQTTGSRQAASSYCEIVGEQDSRCRKDRPIEGLWFTTPVF